MATMKGTLSSVARGCSATLGLVIIYHLSTSGVLVGSSVKEVVDSFQTTIIVAHVQAGSSIYESPRPAGEEYQAADYVPHLHRKLNSFTQVPNFQKLPQDTTPPPQGPSPIQNRVHLQELSADGSKSQMESFTTGGDVNPPIQNQVNLHEVYTDDSWQDQSNSPLISKLHEQKNIKNMRQSSIPFKARKSLTSVNVFQKLPQDTSTPPQGPSPVHNRVHLREISPPSVPVQVRKSVHLQEISSSSAPSDLHTSPQSPLPPLLTSSSESFQSADEELVFQMLPRDTALPPSGPSPIHN